MLSYNQIRILVPIFALICCIASEYNGNYRAGLTEQRIFGGSEALRGQFPHQISLRINITDKFVHNCGGSIISSRFILTAGHCILSRFQNVTSYRIFVDSYEVNDNATAYGVKRFYVHPGYDLSKIIHDVALVELTEEIKFNENVSAIPLEKKFIDGSVRAVTSGWGRTDDKITNLKYAYLYTLSNDDCRALHESRAPIHDFSTLCAYSGKYGTGVCSGDSGGPLVHKGKLIGITSWASLCALGVPDGFTRVSEYYDWIINTMKSAEQEFN